MPIQDMLSGWSPARRFMVLLLLCRVTLMNGFVPSGLPRSNTCKNTRPCSVMPVSVSLHVPKILLGATTSPIENAPDEKENKQFQWSKKTLQLAVPALIGMLADPLLSLMDTAYVGHIGPTELAALGACTSIFHLAFNAFRATTTATTSLVGSAESEEERQQITKISLSFGLVLGFILMVVLESSGPWCLHTMGVPRKSKLFRPAHAYLSTRLYAAPCVLAIVVAEGAFRGYGNTKIPLIASLVASAINFVLDPLLMFPLGMGVRGAAAATAMSQVGAAGVYWFHLVKKRMLPQRRVSNKTNVQTGKVVRTILGANAAMVLKQGSLLLGWAYATARATRIGNAHVAAHQVALSCWLVFALMLDGAAVAAQVLMSKAMGESSKVRSLISYMGRLSIIQGLGTTFLILAAAPVLPDLFTTDKVIKRHLKSLMPHLAWQQLLVSCTLVTESLAVGGNQFRLLAVGTAIATLISMQQIRAATSVVTIWSHGIVALFLGRLAVALVGIGRIWYQHRQQRSSEPTI